MRFKMMTAKQAIDELFNLESKQLDFTFDDINKDPDCDPSGWYGLRLTKIFDEDDYVLAIGYYGGGSTEVYDIYGLVDNSDNEECVKEFCAKKLQDYMNTWSGLNDNCNEICVEI